MGDHPQTVDGTRQRVDEGDQIRTKCGERADGTLSETDKVLKRDNWKTVRIPDRSNGSLGALVNHPLEKEDRGKSKSGPFAQRVDGTQK